MRRRAAAQCFDMNGGFVFGTVHLTDWFGISGEFTGGHSSNISTLGQGLTLTTFTAGPRVSHTVPPIYSVWRSAGRRSARKRFLLSYQDLQLARASSSFAVSTGGGLDVSLNPRYSIRALDLQYLRTSFPNGVNNEQNQLMIGAGLLIKFHGHGNETAAPTPVQPVAPPPPPPPPPPPSVALTCGTNVANVPLGQMVVIYW